MKQVTDLLLPVWSRLSLAACALVLIASVGQAALAQQASGSPATAAKPETASAAGAGQPATARTETAAGEARPAKSGQEGIKVHGHWVIDIRNQDGSLAQHREFENSLTNGAQTLFGIISGYWVPGDWAVTIGPVSGNGPCSFTYTLNGGGGGTSEGCELVRVLSTWPALNDCPEVTCATGLTYSGAGAALYLEGTVIANQTGTIGVVSTFLAYCQGGAPSSCPANAVADNQFTSTTLTTTSGTPPVTTPAPIPVTAGQQIQVSVTISFS